MGYRSRNRSPYQCSISGARKDTKTKRKVSDFQKPIQPKRSRPTKRIHNFAFQNHKDDMIHSLDAHISTPSTKYHRPDNIFNSCNPTISNTYLASTYHSQKGDTQNEYPKQVFNQIKNGNKFDQNSFTTYTQDNSFPRDIQGSSTTILPKCGQNDLSNASNHILIPTKDFWLSDRTNNLLLSLDRDLINLVSGQNGPISYPQITDRASLKIRRQNVIDALFNNEDRQCPNCGLRFSKEDKTSFDNHLDEHFRKKSEINRKKRGELFNRRKWYPDFAKIKSFETTDSEVILPILNTDKKKEESEEKLPMIPIDNIVLGINKDIVRCNLCREDFEQIYVHDQELLYKKHLKYGELKEGWYLKNAIWSGSEVIHPTCSNC